MKSLKLIAVSTIASLIAIPVAIIHSPLDSIAAEGNPSCSTAFPRAAAEIGMKTESTAIAPCSLQNSSVANSEPEMQSTQQISVTKPSSSTNRPSSQVDDFYPAYCATLPAGLTPDDYQFRRALERCKYSY